MTIDNMLRELYSIKKALELQYPERQFSLDGHLIGSVGEVLVSETYGITLYPNSSPVHDGISPDGIEVQIKATQINKVSISSEPEHLIVIKILEDGTWEEIFNGSGSVAWSKAGRRQKNGQRQISVSMLRDLMIDVPDRLRIQRANHISNKLNI